MNDAFKAGIDFLRQEGLYIEGFNEATDDFVKR